MAIHVADGHTVVALHCNKIMEVTQLICGLVVFCCVVIHYPPITTLILTTTFCIKWRFYGMGFWFFLFKIALQ